MPSTRTDPRSRSTRASSIARRIRLSAMASPSSGHRNRASSTTKAKSCSSIGREGPAHPARPGARIRRRRHAVQRGHDPRLGPPREVQRHPGQELRRGPEASGPGSSPPTNSTGTAIRTDDARQWRGAAARHHGEHDVRLHLSLEYISTFTTLKPGDIIVTGTPTGAGARFDPPRWLVPGDVVEVDVPSIGLLRNAVADEA